MEDVRESVGDRPLDFRQVILRQMARIAELQSSGSLAIDAIRALDMLLDPYKDAKYRDRDARLRQAISRLAEDGVSRSTRNQMLANGWQSNLYDLAYRKRLIPQVKSVRVGEELIQGI